MRDVEAVAFGVIRHLKLFPCLQYVTGFLDTGLLQGLNSISKCPAWVIAACVSLMDCSILYFPERERERERGGGKVKYS